MRAIWGATRLGLAMLLVASRLIAAAPSQPPNQGGPTDEKARKTFAEAEQWQKGGYKAIAFDMFRKANQQDGGRCALCLRRAYSIAEHSDDFKGEETVLRDWLPLADTDQAKAGLRLQLGIALQREGLAESGGKREKLLRASCDELKSALTLDPMLAIAHFGLGVTLAHLNEDDAARAEFKEFLARNPGNPEYRQRAARYVDRIELARAQMAPPFAVTTLDGQRISMDNLAGKVVLIDFWATWCGPCRQALPHIRDIARKFQGQPFVVLSVSMDDDAARWKDFVAHNEMTWLQYRDGRFTGPMAKMFGVNAIPSTFSIDADGVLEDQHVGDASIDGKLKKMLARAVELEKSKPAQTAADAAPAEQ